MKKNLNLSEFAYKVDATLRRSADRAEMTRDLREGHADVYLATTDEKTLNTRLVDLNERAVQSAYTRADNARDVSTAHKAAIDVGTFSRDIPDDVRAKIHALRSRSWELDGADRKTDINVLRAESRKALKASMIAAAEVTAASNKALSNAVAILANGVKA